MLRQARSPWRFRCLNCASGKRGRRSVRRWAACWRNTRCRSARRTSAPLPARRQNDAGEDRGDAHGVEGGKGFAEEGDGEERGEGRQKVEREAGGGRADRDDAAVPEQ